MSRSKRKRQCARHGCTCKPRCAARRKREAIADERRDARHRNGEGSDPWGGAENVAHRTRPSR